MKFDPRLHPWTSYSKHSKFFSVTSRTRHLIHNHRGRMFPSYKLSCAAPIRLDATEAKNADFDTIWSQGLPMLISGVGKDLQLSWSPLWFTEHHGNELVEVIDCGTGKGTPQRVVDFFAMFGQPHPKPVLKIKVNL